MTLRLSLIGLVTATCSVMLVVAAFDTGTLQFGRNLVEYDSTTVDPNSTTYNSMVKAGLHRKLLLHNHATAAGEVQPNRNWEEKCSTSDIAINQGQTDPLPSGIPTYTVLIMNACPTGCDISGIHLKCGWFSSARLINPNIFKRLRYDDCLVNNGNKLLNGASVIFQYANTYSYPLSVSSVIC